ASPDRNTNDVSMSPALSAGMSVFQAVRRPVAGSRRSTLTPGDALVRTKRERPSEVHITGMSPDKEPATGRGSPPPTGKFWSGPPLIAADTDAPSVETAAAKPTPSGVIGFGVPPSPSMT